MSDPFLGEIRTVGFNFAPSGWALCQGNIMSISQNNALFALLGTTFGGNGQTTFGLPDLRGRSPVGQGQGLGLSPVVMGQQAGTENATLTVNQMPAHTHTATVTGGITVSGNISVPATTATTGGGGIPGPTTVFGPITAGGRSGDLYSTAAATTTLAPFAATLSSSTPPAIQIGSTGQSQPFSILGPYLGLNFIIALQGVFPSRG